MQAKHNAAPCVLQIKGHFSVPVQWLNLVQLTDDYAIFKVWPTEQDRIAVTHVMDMPGLEWAKIEQGKYYMTRAVRRVQRPGLTFLLFVHVSACI